MKHMFAFSCLLSTLSIVEMKRLIINGHVGQSVTIDCSDLNNMGYGKENVKYFCNSPCSRNKDIIAKAKYGKTVTYKNRIELKNNKEGFLVTFTNLKKSDSKTYECGLERYFSDPLIEVKLNVFDAQRPSPKTTPKTVIVGSTMSSSSSGVTDVSSSYTTLNTTAPKHKQGSVGGSLPYLVAGVIAIIIILMALLKLVHKMMKHQTKVVSSADGQQEDAQEDVHYDEIRPGDQTDPDVLYANCSHHHGTAGAAESRNSDGTNDFLYSVAQLPKNQTAPVENESIYSLAQLL